jgi:glucoamylase
MSEPLEAWIERQYRHCAAAILRSVSPVAIVKDRPEFALRIVPRKGAVVASPVLGAYDPEPDYFYHWYRDSALIIDALRLLHADGSARPQALGHFADFVHFSLSLDELDGRILLESPQWRDAVAEPFRQYLRSDEDLARVHGPAVAADTRVNADGSLDITSWGRPQHDGPALRALTVLRWSRAMRFDAELAAAVAELVHADLTYTRERWREPCIDIWEEELGWHYYTLRVAAAALEDGAAWLEQRGERREARHCRAEAGAILERLEGYWTGAPGLYRSRVLASGAQSGKELDISVIFAAIHAGGESARHSVHDVRTQATLARLETLFGAAYAINHNRPAERAPALGRYAGDQYYSGGAYYFSTLAAAEFCFRAARGAGAAEGPGLKAHGDAFLETVRAFTPASGALSEQFDQTTGEQTSAKELAWSYAAFISCIAARRSLATGSEAPP